MFYIRGGGNGHGIGMSQYGAYGYALHGKELPAGSWPTTTRARRSGQTDPNRTVRVLLATGPAAFSGASRRGRQARCSPSDDLHGRAERRRVAQRSLTSRAGQAASARFTAPLTVTGPGPLNVTGLGTYRGALEFRPTASGGVETVDAVGLDGLRARRDLGGDAGELGARRRSRPRPSPPARTRSPPTSAAAASTLYSDTRSQMYGGVAAETPSTDAAVAATRGQVVTYDGVPGRDLLLRPARAVTPRTSRTCGRARRPSRGCAACPTRTTAPAEIRTTTGAMR